MRERLRLGLEAAAASSAAGAGASSIAGCALGVHSSTLLGAGVSGVFLGERFDEVGGAAVDDVVVCDEVSLILFGVQDQKSLLLPTNKILFSVSQFHAVTAIPVGAVIFFLRRNSF